LPDATAAAGAAAEQEIRDGRGARRAHRFPRLGCRRVNYGHRAAGRRRLDVAL